MTARAPPGSGSGDCDSTGAERTLDAGNRCNGGHSIDVAGQVVPVQLPLPAINASTIASSASTRSRRSSNDNGHTLDYNTMAPIQERSNSAKTSSCSTMEAIYPSSLAAHSDNPGQALTHALLPGQVGHIASIPTLSAATSLNAESYALASLPGNGSSPLYIRQPFAQFSNFQHAYSSERHTAELTNCVIAFLSPILPTEEEYRIKEATRRQLERFAQTVSPDARLLMFGSNSNGFALKSSDMDLCCLLSPSEQNRSASELVEELGRVLREQTDYAVMTLPKARIPIIKLRRAPKAGVPYDLSCDIGFENRLALENTRLLLSYAMVDAPRLRTLVLFLKVWAKRRKLNSPFTGTLSSYGYTLMMLYFLIHVKRPAVLPNLQRFPGPIDSAEESATYFYDDVASLRSQWSTTNTEKVGELLVDFFRFFAKDFVYAREVISIRSDTGTFPKDHHAWNADLCIEDPFGNYNVARTVTKDGLYTIRGEFIRASRILTTRTDRVSAALAELCEEREDSLTRAPDPSHFHRNPRNGMAAMSAAYYDPRYLRDLTRRFESGAMFNKGGSFAFEEMARGLAQAQQAGCIPVPPTTAMLAPLSQNVGLVKQGLMRAGLRYDATPRAAATPSGNASVPNTPRISSSARSEPSYARKGPESGKKGKTAGTKANSGNISVQNSPRLHNAAARDSATSEAGSSYDVGEAFAFGSEITFGSQRFHLYPQEALQNDHHRQERSKSNADMLSPSSAAYPSDNQGKAGRSFSDGLSRSMSLPRQPSVNERRSSTPAAAEAQFEALKEAAPTAMSARRSSDGLCANDSYEEDASGLPERSPFLTAQPWTFVAPMVGPPTTKLLGAFDGRGLGMLDDEFEARTSISDGTVDDATRVSALDSSTGVGLSEGEEAVEDGGRQGEGTPLKANIKHPPNGRVDDVVAWAASQREQIDRERQSGRRD